MLGTKIEIIEIQIDLEEKIVKKLVFMKLFLYFCNVKL